MDRPHEHITNGSSIGPGYRGSTPQAASGGVVTAKRRGRPAPRRTGGGLAGLTTGRRWRSLRPLGLSLTPLGSGLRTCLRQPEHVCPHCPFRAPYSLTRLEPVLRIDFSFEAFTEATPSRPRHRLAAVTRARCETPDATPRRLPAARH